MEKNDSSELTHDNCGMSEEDFNECVSFIKNAPDKDLESAIGDAEEITVDDMKKVHSYIAETKEKENILASLPKVKLSSIRVRGRSNVSGQHNMEARINKMFGANVVFENYNGG